MKNKIVNEMKNKKASSSMIENANWLNNQIKQLDKAWYGVDIVSYIKKNNTVIIKSMN